MTKKHFLWITLACLLAAPVLAQNVDEIIAKNIETRGGMDALKGVESAHINGTMTMGQGMEVPFDITFKRPRKMRFEMEMQGMKIIQAYDGETGWGVMPMMGKSEPERLADDQLKQAEMQSDIDGPLVDYAEKGHTVELLGKEDVEGTEAYKLKVTLKNGDEINMYLDAEYYLVFKQEAKTNIQGNEVSVTSNISDYKEVGDVVLPHAMEQVFEGAPSGMTMTMNKVELNVDVDDSIFDMPEPAPQEEESEDEQEG